jgi:hypothetical protein
MRISSRLTDRGWAFVSTWLLGSFFFALVLGSSPELHARVHHDANQPGHTCAVTLIASGSVDHAPVAPVIMATADLEFAKAPALAPVWVESSFRNSHIFAHAPPVAA